MGNLQNIETLNDFSLFHWSSWALSSEKNLFFVMNIWLYVHDKQVLSRTFDYSVYSTIVLYP